MQDRSSSQARDIYSVGRLNREVGALLGAHFPALWVEGEISNLSTPASGHVYFTLKDAKAQVSCAMFRSRATRLPFRPRDGLQVLLRGRVGLYEARGNFQLIVDSMSESGEGALQRAYEALRERLHAEGLFDEALKRPLPTLPRRIGIVTSPSGAALRDILKVLKRRFPAVPVLIYPVPVQGPEAAPAIVKALECAGVRADCDVLIAGRGGGSLEDLWAFNEEAVARAIRACPIPVISAVGHEIDFSIADFAADLRAPTPSAAAELAVPDAAEWIERARRTRVRLGAAQSRQLRELGSAARALQARLLRQHPGRRLAERMLRLDELDTRLRKALAQRSQRARQSLASAVGRLRALSPQGRLATLRARLDACQKRLGPAQQRAVARRRSQVDSLERALAAVGPQATLARGYAIVTTASATGHQIVRDARSLASGTQVHTRLARGTFTATVDQTDEDDTC